MREKKFRAWDKIAKKFLYPWPDGFHILGETTCFDLIGQQLKERNPEKSTLSMLNDIEITEYTGRKDKDGKEIYEKDIVEEGGGRGVVEWDELQLKYQYKTCFGTAGFYGFIGKVIGNIYENKDLING